MKAVISGLILILIVTAAGIVFSGMSEQAKSYLARQKAKQVLFVTGKIAPTEEAKTDFAVLKAKEVLLATGKL